MSQIPVQHGQLANGFCPATYQDMLHGFSGVQFVDIDAVSTKFLASLNPPADHNSAWLQVDSAGYPIRLYYYSNGAWLSPHPTMPGMSMLWNQVLPDFTTFDGGDGSSVTSTTGPMWQLMATTLDGKAVAPDVNVMAAKFPVGVGQFIAEDGVTPGRIVSLATRYGNASITLNQQMMPPHYHGEKTAVNRKVTDNADNDPTGAGGFVGPLADGGTELNTRVVGGNPDTAPVDGVPTTALAHENLPPCYGLYFLQRTNRLYYRIDA